MAAKRSIPTTLFESPDFFELSSDTIRLILIGIILDADDEGRGSAHPRLLARKLDKQPADMEQALTELEAHGILRCYTVDTRRYYVLCHWHKYQVLSRPTPSLYPSPPDTQAPDPFQEIQGMCGDSRDRQESPGESLSEEERETEEQHEREEKERTEEEAWPARITRFPAARLAHPSPPTSSGDGSVFPLASRNLEELIAQVASLLHLAVTTDLRTIVQEFAAIPTISLTGEAIEARAWIADHRRNHKGQSMTPAFFRRWLKRERGDYGQPRRSGAPAPSVQPAFQAARSSEKSHATPAPAISHSLSDPYQEYVRQRAAAIQAATEQKVVGG